MLAYLEDQAALLLIQFTESGEPFIPDADSVTWTLRDHTGTAVSGYIDTPVVTGVLDIQKAITIPGSQNAIDAARRYEKRTVSVSALRSGQPWFKNLTYHILPWTNHTVTPDAVRVLAGIEEYDLPNDQIDIWNAYLSIETLLGAEALSTALSSGLETEVKANRAIAAQAMLNALPSLQTRLLKRRSDGSIQAERFSIDLNSLELRLRGFIAEAALLIRGDNGASPLLFSFGAPTDPVTG